MDTSKAPDAAGARLNRGPKGAPRRVSRRAKN